MAKNLVIVESPAKAKTIEKFLGSEYQVESSYGHIADLPSREIGVDVENGFKPKYEVSADKKALVTKLKGLAKNAEMVWLASDEDREGEAISWHLAEELKLPLLGQIPLVQGLRESGDIGFPAALVENHPARPHFRALGISLIEYMHLRARAQAQAELATPTQGTTDHGIN